MTDVVVLNKSEIWSVAQDIATAFSPFYQRQMNRALREGNAWLHYFPAFIAQGVFPEALALDRYHDRIPYSTRDTLRNNLEAAVEGGILERTGENVYKITVRGTAGISAGFKAAHKQLHHLQPLPSDELARLTGYLQRIVEMTLAAPEPADKIALLTSRWTDPGEDASFVARLDQYITDLNHYRDDAHVAAWQPYGVGGQVWEVFTYVWREEFSNATGAVEYLSGRGYTTEDYQTAFQELVAKGWLAEKEGEFTITEAGRRLREDAEAETDRLFFSGWGVLSESELADMNDLLIALRASLWRSIAERIWQTVSETSQDIFRVIGSDWQQTLREIGIENTWFWIDMVKSQEPDALRMENITYRSPYRAPHRIKDMFQEAINAGHIYEADGGYRLTESGQQAFHRDHEVINTLLGTVPVLGEAQMDQLIELLRRLTTQMSESEITPKVGLKVWRNLFPEGDIHKLTLIDYFYDSLSIFRDDAHLAAWLPYGVTGHEWELLTFIWRGQIDTPEAAERISNRGYNANDHRIALQALVKKGWLAESNGHFSITAKGTQIREEAEAKTNDFYFAPWAVLSGVELVQMAGVVNNLRDAIRGAYQDRIAERCKDLYPILNEIVQQYFPLYRDKLQPVLQSEGLDKHFALFSLHLVKWAGDSPLNIDLILERFPYMSGKVWQERLQTLMESDVIRLVEGGYGATDKALWSYNQINKVFYEALDEIGSGLKTPLPHLMELLERVTKSCAEMIIPPGAVRLHRVQNTDPGSVGPLSRVDYAYDLLNAFRDDAHIAAWLPNGLEGYVWEAFTFVWKEEAATAAELQEKLSFRGHSEALYDKALQSLTKAGWLQEIEGKYALTDEGKRVREEAEKLTDRYFYAPWAILSEEETHELRGLLTQLKEEVTALADKVRQQ